MPTDHEGPRSRPTSPRSPPLLWCGVCGATKRSAPEDLLRYTRSGWPQHCNQVMCYFPGIKPPNPVTYPSPTTPRGPTATE